MAERRIRAGVGGADTGQSKRTARSSSRARSSPPAWIAVPALLVAAVVTWTHWPVLSAQARSFDDEEAIVDNHLVQNPGWHSVGRFFGEVTRSSVVRGYYRPLTLTSLMLDWAMGGRPDNLRAFHRTSLVLHVGSTVLVILLCYQLFHRPVLAAMVGLLFGVHPMTVEPVAWVMERKTILAAIFTLGALNAYVRYTRTRGWGWYLAAAGFYLISLLAKPTGTPLPLMMMLMDYWPLNRFDRRAMLEKLPFFILAAAFAVLCVVCEQKVNVLTVPAMHSPLHLPLRICWLVVFYPWKILLPVNLSSVYMLPDPLVLSNGLVLLAVALTAAMIAGLVCWRRRWPALWTGAAIFYVGLAPTMGFVGYSWVSASDKYAYLPAVGLLLVLAWLMNRLIPDEPRPGRHAAIVGTGTAAVAILLIVGTRHYLRQWQTTERLALHMLRLAPDSPNVNLACGKLYQDQGNHTQALEHYAHAVAAAPDYADVYYNRGVLYSDTGEHERAIAEYTRTIELQPDCVEAYHGRGNAYSDLGRYEPAVADFTRAIELDPELAEAWNNRGSVYSDLGDHDRAVFDCTRAIALNPRFAEAYNNRGSARIALGQHEPALEDYSRAIELKPDFAEAWYNRANACASRGDYTLAVEGYNSAVSLRPTQAAVYCQRRGFAHAELGQYDLAVADFTKAILMAPDDAESYRGRGTVYGRAGDWDKAIADLTRAVEMRPQDASAWSNRGNAFLGKQEFERAIQDYTRAIEIAPGYADAYLNRAIAHHAAGDDAKARTDVEKCRALGGEVDDGFLDVLERTRTGP